MNLDDDYPYELRTAAYEAVAVGEAELTGEDEDGEPTFRLTPAGRARAEAIIDAAILAHGDDAAEALAEALGVSVEVGEAIVNMRTDDTSATAD